MKVINDLEGYEWFSEVEDWIKWDYDYFEITGANNSNSYFRRGSGMLYGVGIRYPRYKGWAIGTKYKNGDWEIDDGDFIKIEKDN